jgi:hypothetical protein
MELKTFTTNIFTFSLALPLLAVALLAGSVGCSYPRAEHAAAQKAPPVTTAPVVTAVPTEKTKPAASAHAVEVVASDRAAPAPALKSHHRQLSKAEQEMLRTVDPTRVYRTAAAKKGVPTLTIVGPSEQRIPTLGSATLVVEAAPEALVTFATSDGGVFANNAASITVLADAEGRATAVMKAPPGTVDDVPVRVGSPSAIGTVTLLVHVLYPGSPLQATSSH